MSLAMAVVGCGQGAAATAEAVDGHVHLVVELPSTSWHAGEQLAGTATLSFDGPDRLEFWSSSFGPFVYKLIAADGSVRSAQAGSPDLRQSWLPASTPLVRSIPLHAAEPLERGDWVVEVEAVYIEGHSASGREHRLKTSIAIRVLG